MIYFIGAGPGAVDLITVKGAKILSEAQIIIYAGSLVNPEIIKTYARSDCEVFDSAFMTLEEILEKLLESHKKNLVAVRLHSGDPALYGAIREQINFLEQNKIPFEIVPGVSSLFAASAALKTEFMIPEISQSLLISRIEGRTSAPKNFGTVLFLSSVMIEKACEELKKTYSSSIPAALVYKASWPDEKIIRGTLETLPALAKEAGINKTALILVGDFLDKNFNTKSKLYDKNFSHEYRK